MNPELNYNTTSFSYIQSIFLFLSLNILNHYK